MRTKKIVKELPENLNRTMVKWLEDNCPTCAFIISVSIQKDKKFETDKDVYHQDFHMSLKIINAFLSNHEYTDSYLFMETGMQEDLFKIEEVLRPKIKLKRKQ